MPAGSRSSRPTVRSPPDRPSLRFRSVVLAELNIRNFALIERQRVVFGPGLSVMSGGTGAGKSLVIDALKLVLGGRGTTDVIRVGADEASVEALFYVDSPGERARVAAAAPTLVEGG